MIRTDSGRAHHPGPFVGARPFSGRDRRLFFGRVHETQALVESWKRHRLTVLSGDVGVGKSSLLDAGAVPALTDQGAEVLPAGRLCFDPAFPAALLPDHNPYTRALVAAWDPPSFPTHGPGTDLSDYLRGRERTDRYGRQRPLFAAFDQTETLLRPAAADQSRRDFLDELLTAAESRPAVRLLLTVRTEHLDDLRRLIDKRDVDHAELFLEQFTPEAATDVATRTLASVGNRYGGAVVEHLMAEVRVVRGADGHTLRHTAGVDPALLQTIGRLLCAREPGDAAQLDVDRALTEHLAQVLEEAAAEHLVPPDVPHAWLRRVVAAGDDGVGAPAHTDPDSTLTRGLVHTLQDRHLVAEHGSGSAFRLRHPRLARPLTALALSPYAASSPTSWTAEDRLAVSCEAHTRGESALAEEHARQALDGDPPPGTRTRAMLTALLGDVAFGRGEHARAAVHYAGAAGLLEAVGDGAAVPRLLAAQARSHLSSGDRASALDGLAAAAGRVHADPSLRTGIGQGLWEAGQAEAALDILDSVLVGQAGVSEARRVRGRIRAEPAAVEHSRRSGGR